MLPVAGFLVLGGFQVAIQFTSNGSQDISFIWKPERTLPDNQFVSNPYGKFSYFSFVIAYLFAKRANGNNSAQGFDPVLVDRHGRKQQHQYNSRDGQANSQVCKQGPENLVGYFSLRLCHYEVPAEFRD